ncbi:MAG: amino acid adenylation domain-containing protein [Nostoc sp.]|uniref:non-ribosomal peptide synthetase n=1 Tax=Nostoc sp. TaxID=1180 RepID=UPI002FF5E173
MSNIQIKTPSKTKNIESIYPLSSMQQGVLFHSLYAPESGVYFNQTTLSLKGNVSTTAFESAWQKVVEKHSILRTLFVWQNRQTPLQIVLKQINLPWNNLDWRRLSPTEQQQQFLELLLTQREQGFQFDQAPLMECTLIQLSEDTYKFILNFHQILMDGWSVAVIFKEVLSLYETGVRGETYYLPTPRPYRDYIAWLNSQDRQVAIKFWQQTLQGFSAPTSLVVDKFQYLNQQQNSYYHQELELRLSAQVNRQLQDIAQHYHVTLSTIVQAAWALLLSRYSGEKDVVFGVTVSGRPGSFSGVENMVGLFTNTLPLRLEISPQQQLIPWLGQIQQLMLELQDYSYTPLVDIQAKSELLGRRLLFESIVVFENYPVDSSLLDEGSSLQLNDIESFDRNNYPLTVAVVPEDELLVKIIYDAVRFEEDTIGRLLGHLQTIFSAIAENPQQAVGELPLLSEAERYQLLSGWNDTQTEYAKERCFHQLFEAQVEQTPDAIAVVFKDEQLTYRELNRRANQLAYHLQKLGVKPEVIVGLCVERSLSMVIGVLAILKAGGAYLPLDPTYPSERLAFILSDSQVPILLTTQKLVTELLQHTAQVVCLDTEWATIAQESEQNPNSGVIVENLAYLIYTSGSTGTPKGVLVTHQGLGNLTKDKIRTCKVQPDSRILQFFSLSFDASIPELVMALGSGAALHLGTPEDLLPGFALMKLLREQAITHITLPPSALAVLPTPELPALQMVLVGGEAPSLELIAQWSKGRLFINAYGPTETTVNASMVECGNGGQSLPTVRPAANKQLYILDQHLQPVPIAVPGELHIGGVGLARGYLNRPEKTAETFIPNPFSDELGSRLYKTGDLACYLSDGHIRLLGRLDHQVKIRGFRIEPGEIEALLTQHPGVRESIVIVREDQPGDKRLVAYVVPDPENNPTIGDLRRFLAEKLPNYMIPAAFVTLDALPLNANGKVDRFALPVPDTARPELESAFVAPSTPTEQILADIFAKVLEVEQVGVHDNFFELGGHSLLATQLVAQLLKTFEVEVTVVDLFEAPTVTGLAERIEKMQTLEKLSSLPLEMVEEREEIEI